MTSSPSLHWNQLATIRGVPVLAPEQVRNFPCPILITTTLHEKEIVDRIAELGLTNRVITLGDPPAPGVPT